MKNKTKPGPHMGHARFKAHKAAMRRRETWMPTMQQAIFNERENRAIIAKRVRCMSQRKPTALEIEKPATPAAPTFKQRLARKIVGIFRKRAVTP